jgi:hypothetical protein
LLFGAQGAKNVSRTFMTRAGIDKLASVAAAAAVLCALAALGERTPPPAPPIEPAVRIPVAPLGYKPPGAFYLTYRLSSAALGFFDDDHLLFTFHIGGLLQRVPDDPADDDDQQIRAVVLNVTTGKAEQQTEWRMHDRSQYLWPYKDGKFLVRVRDSLFVTDASLTLEPYLTFSSGLRVIQVSPDRKMLAVETNYPIKLHSEAAEPQAPRMGQPIKVMILPLGSKTPIAESEGQNASLLPLMGDGLLDTMEGRLQASWVMRDVPFRGDPKIVGEVKSSCQPSVEPVSAKVALMVGCYLDGDDRPVSAFSMDGAELWRDRWQNRYVWGWFDTAENGSRFAYESVAVSRPISTFDALYPEDITGQIVGVYDTESGKLVLVKDVSPVLTAGQNAALSRDGTRFAVLRNGAIEVYDLPPVEPPRQKAPEVVAKKKK